MAESGTHNLGDNSAGAFDEGKSRFARAYARIPRAFAGSRAKNRQLRASASKRTVLITGLFLGTFFTFLGIRFYQDSQSGMDRAERVIHSAAALNAAHLDALFSETNALLTLIDEASPDLSPEALSAFALTAERTATSVHRIVFVDQFGNVVDETGKSLTTGEADAVRRAAANGWGLNGDKARLVFPSPGKTSGADKSYFTLSHRLSSGASSIDDPRRLIVALLPAQLMDQLLSSAGTRSLLGRKGTVQIIAPSGQTQIIYPIKPNRRHLAMAEQAELVSKDTGALKTGYLDLPRGDALYSKQSLAFGADLIVLLPMQDAMSAFWHSFWLYIAFSAAAIFFAMAFASFLSMQVRATESSDHMLEQSEQLFELAAQGAKCGIWNWSLDDETMYWSSSIMKLLGFESGGVQLSFDQALNLVHPNDRKYLRRVEKSMRGGQREFDTKFRLKHADGHFIWMRARGEVRVARQRNGEEKAPERTFYGIIIDMTDELMATAREEQARMTLNNAIENISDGFVLWDRNRQISVSNSIFEKTKPFGPEEAWAAIDEDLEKEVGEGRWLQIKSNRVSGGGVVTLARDITDLKTKNAALEDSRTVLGDTITDLKTSRSHLKVLASKFEEEKLRAEEASRSKTEFLANMSHELRTPLNAIIGFSEIMETGMFGPLGDDRYEEYASDIRKSGRSLLELIDDILDMSRIERGKYDVDCQPIVTGDLIEDCLRLVEPRAAEKHIDIKNEAGSVPKVFVDKGAAKHVLLNVLSNAVKFSEDGGDIRLSMTSDLHWVTLIVEDNGIGIEKENLEKLGLPFVQFESHSEKRFQGSGLGLAISMSLIEMMSGKLTIKSEVGKGTKVFVKLPRREMAA